MNIYIERKCVVEENAKKITPWKIIKWTLLLISALVYLLTFIRLFVACDADICDDIILTASEKKDFDNLDKDYPLYNYQPSSWTNEEGTVQIKNVYYLEPLSEVQLTVRYKISTFEEDGNTTPFTYGIRVVEGDEKVESEDEKALYKEDLAGDNIEHVELHTESRYDYKYVRICASGITVDDGEKKTERVQIVDEDGNTTYDLKDITVGGNKVYLDIYDSKTNELLYSFVVAGKTVGGVRTRRSKVDVRVIG